MPWRVAKDLYSIANDPDFDLVVRYEAVRLLQAARGRINTPSKTEKRRFLGTAWEITPEVQSILAKTAEQRRKRAHI